MPYRIRFTEQVVAEMQADDQPYAVFIDNNLGSRRDYLRQLCAAIKPLEKIWSAAVTIDITDDPSLVREMALAGCTGVFIGFETIEPVLALSDSPSPDGACLATAGGNHPPEVPPPIGAAGDRNERARRLLDEQRRVIGDQAADLRMGFFQYVEG